MPYRRLVPKTVDIKSNKTLVHNVCFGYFIDIVTSIPEGDQTTGEWRGLHNVELYHYFSQNTIPVIKSREMRWVGHVARVGESRDAYRVELVNLREINHFERLRIDRRVTLK